MKADPTFLSLDNILVIHNRMISEFGGAHGIRDQGLLESAVAMPMARFEGTFLHPGIPDMAAAYGYHLWINHAFLDGNKRVAIACAEIFLMLNDWKLDADNNNLEKQMLGIADGTLSKKELTDSFCEHCCHE